MALRTGDCSVRLQNVSRTKADSRQTQPTSVLSWFELRHAPLMHQTASQLVEAVPPYAIPPYLPPQRCPRDTTPYSAYFRFRPAIGMASRFSLSTSMTSWRVLMSFASAPTPPCVSGVRHKIPRLSRSRSAPEMSSMLGEVGGGAGDCCFVDRPALREALPPTCAERVALLFKHRLLSRPETADYSQKSARTILGPQDGGVGQAGQG